MIKKVDSPHSINLHIKCLSNVSCLHRRRVFFLSSLSWKVCLTVFFLFIIFATPQQCFFMRALERGKNFNSLFSCASFVYGNQRPLRCKKWVSLTFLLINVIRGLSASTCFWHESEQMKEFSWKGFRMLVTFKSHCALSVGNNFFLLTLTISYPHDWSSSPLAVRKSKKITKNLEQCSKAETKAA